MKHYQSLHGLKLALISLFLGSVGINNTLAAANGSDTIFKNGFEPAGPVFVVGQNINDVGVDTPGDPLDDYVVNDNANTSSGTITGSDTNDVLVGDSGGVFGQGVDGNIVLILDTSGSMDNQIEFDGQVVTRLEALQLSIEDFLQQISKSGAENIRIHIVEYNTNSPIGNTYDLIENGAINLNVLALANDDVSNLQAIGFTNYEAGLQRALDWIGGNNTLPDNGNLINQLIFISDGDPNRALEETNGANDFSLVESRSATEAMNEVLGIDPSGGNNGDNSNEVAFIEQNFGPIEAIGIDVSGSNLDRLSLIDSDIASNVVSGDELLSLLSSLLFDLSPLIILSDTGDDSIIGNGGDDIIFGDVLNTDTIAANQGINLPPGSGWEVFAELENDASNSWGRTETLQYISIQGGALITESNRNGGNDILYGGAGNDYIYGQEGDDLINAGTGINSVYGGSGNNVFEFNINDLLDPGSIIIINNLNLISDILSFSDVLDIGANGADVDDLNQYIKSIDSFNGDTVIQFKDSPDGNGDGGIIILAGYDAGVQAGNDITALVDVMVNVDVE